MSTIQHEQCTIELIDKPAEFYEANGRLLDEVGANAFSQPAETFGVQVAERFKEAGLAHIFRHADKVIGFALYSLIPLDARYLWQACAV